MSPQQTLSLVLPVPFSNRETDYVAECQRLFLDISVQFVIWVTTCCPEEEYDTNTKANLCRTQFLEACTGT